MIDYENIFIVLSTFLVGFSYWLVNRIILFWKGAGGMKAKEMATAIQNLCNDFGINSSVFADDLADYVDKVAESYVANGASATISLIPADSQLFTVDGTYYTPIETSYYRPRRLKCDYCGCISSKESGTCEHCGAPLVEEEY